MFQDGKQNNVSQTNPEDRHSKDQQRLKLINKTQAGSQACFFYDLSGNLSAIPKSLSSVNSETNFTKSKK